MRAFLFALPLMIGCAQRAPGDGSLVLLDVSQRVADFQDRVGGVARMEPAIARGANRWNAVGARVRLASDFGADPPNAFHLHVVAADSFESSLAGGESSGWYSYVDGKIHIVLPPPPGGNGDEEAWANVFTHEIGHAMGLDHVAGCNMMSTPACADGHRDALGDGDIEEFRRVWN